MLSANAQLEGSVENYDAVLVTLLADTAQYYMTMRGTQERIELAKENAKLQREASISFKHAINAGAVHALDVYQQQSTLSATEAAIPALEIVLRQSQDQLCTLLGIPPADSAGPHGIAGPIPAAPATGGGHSGRVASTRPGYSRRQSAAAAQAQQIGIAQADLYPHISITGTLGYSASTASQLFTPQLRRSSRAVIYVEHPQLWPDRQQRQFTGCHFQQSPAWTIARRCSRPTKRPRTAWPLSCNPRNRTKSSPKAYRRQESLSDRHQPV